MARERERQLEDLVKVYRDALWFVIGACRQAATTPDRWERACRLSEAAATEALNLKSQLSDDQHHLAPDFTDEERRQNEHWAKEKRRYLYQEFEDGREWRSVGADDAQHISAWKDGEDGWEYGGDKHRMLRRRPR